MATDRFYIGPFSGESGLQKDLKPFMIPETAFAQLNNAYCWRGRIRKRFGTTWLGQTANTTRLRIGVTTTDGGGSASGTVPGSIFKIGQAFSIGTNFFTVYQTGNPGTLLIDGSASTATFDTTTGAFAFTGVTALTTVYWYPADPVMGLINPQNAIIDNQATIAFDTQFAYQYNNGWDRLGVDPAGLWHGSNSQYFWGVTWQGAEPNIYTLFVTNFNENEPQFMRYLVGTTWFSWGPTVSVTNSIVMVSALILIPFKNRLLAFNVWEKTGVGSPIQYANRLRFSTTGSPIDLGPSYFPWNTDVNGLGGTLDFPTTEAIVTVQYIKDRLIVYMEQSTWEVVYLNNQVDPFAVQQINTEFGSECTFSNVPFDKVVLTIGNIGIIGCTGANVERIDQKIPDDVFQVQNLNNGIQRVYGIRDYFVEMVYWTFPDDTVSSVFPFLKRILVYDYRTGTWSFNDDSFTVFGYFQPQTGILWSDQVVLWSDNVSWESGSIDGFFRQVIAGNQEGWTFLVKADTSVNAASLQITNITYSGTTVTLTVIDYNMVDEDYIYITGIKDDGNIGSTLNGNIFKIKTNPSDANVITIQIPADITLTGDYQGSGVVARVSRIQLLTKQFNFYLDKGRNFYVNRVDFLVDRTGNAQGTAGGEIGVDYFVSTSDLPMVDAGIPQPGGTGALVGTSILETTPYISVPFEKNASQLWHPLYFQGDGEFIQLDIKLTDDEMLLVRVMEAPFQLHAMLFWCQLTSQYPR